MLSEKILEMRNKAHETNAANKIIDMLVKLRKSNNDLSKRRWVWELIQNAKDAVNSTNKVNISIIFDETIGVVEFKHNGKLFTSENLVFLIEQVSSKDRSVSDESKKKTTGKFGTGFLTTHLLSEKVMVSGLLQDEGEIPKRFAVDLDRTGRTKQMIISAIQASCEQLSSCLDTVNAIDENNYNTSFQYALDAAGIETAKQGLENLKVAAPYILAFVPEINCIDINNGQMSFQRVENPSIGLNNAYVLVVRQNHDMIRYICVSGNEDVAVAVEIGRQGRQNIVCENSPHLPKLFCDFPLIGTEEFAFPVVVNSPLFSPNEPRDGIWLNDNDEEDTNENKELLKKAVGLYQNLLKYLNTNNFECIYNIVYIRNPVKKEWLSMDWLKENILVVLKSFISEEEIITTNDGKKESIVDNWGDSNILLMSDSSEFIREKTWELTRFLSPNNITKHDEIEKWYASLWPECHNYGLSDLILRVEEMRDVSTLSKKLNGSIDVFGWLIKLYDISFNRRVNDSTFYNLKIFPNQDGQLCALNSLQIGSEIDDIYKDLSPKIGMEITNRLVDSRIERSVADFVKEYTLNDFFSELEKRYDDWVYDYGDFCLQFLCFRQDDNYLNEEHKEMVAFITKFYPEIDIKSFNVSRYSKKLLINSLRYWRGKLISDISDCGNLDCFLNRFEFQQCTEVLNKFVYYLIKYQYSDHLNWNDSPILPNQNGDFIEKDRLYIESDEIDDIFKDICRYTGDDVRGRLLHTDICLELPPERNIDFSYIAEKITNHIEENYKNENLMSNDDFRKLFIWLKENKESKKVTKYFRRLSKHIYWLYNDDDIAMNMEKADQLDSLLSKFGISDANNLEKILEKAQQSETAEDNATIEINQELLAQYGISTEEGLKRALENGIFGENFVHYSGSYGDCFSFVQMILERSKKNVINYLSSLSDDGYDLTDILEIAPTIYVIKKRNQEIYLMIRPSDYNQVIIYYDSEFDLLDYKTDWELWVEDGKSRPHKLTFGKILKLTGVNKIPLRKVR